MDAEKNIEDRLAAEQGAAELVAQAAGQAEQAAQAEGKPAAEQGGRHRVIEGAQIVFAPMPSETLGQDLADLAGHDHVVRGIAADGTVRAFAATTRETVEAAHEAHQTSPVVTAALGRLLTAGAIMGSTLKDEDEIFTLTIRSEGPIGGLTVTADSHGHVKGYAQNPDVWNELTPAGKLDVGGAVGPGRLTVVRDATWAEPYTSTTDLVTGEIGDDLTEYYAQSEQTPTAVGVGVLVDIDLSVRQAGGFIVQLMPDCAEAAIDRLEANLEGLTSVTDLLERGKSPLQILEQVLDGLDFQPLEASPCDFRCNCSRGRTERLLVTLGAKQLQSLIDDAKPTELVCQFCGKRYSFEVEELRRLLVRAQMKEEAEVGTAKGDVAEASAAGGTVAEAGAPEEGGAEKNAPEEGGAEVAR